uniref:Peptidase M13 N-terminal domain-containing protein n=1 Tax=Panagrolaimus davidi TaxID=227884 RepID=A0A914R4G3_9BILA
MKFSPLPIKQVKQMYHQCKTDKTNWATITANGTYLKSIVADFEAKTKLPFPLSKNLHPLSPTPIQASMALGYLSGKHGIDTLISQYIDTNNKDPLSDKPYMLILDQPTLSYPWTYYIGKTWNYTKPKLSARVKQILAEYLKLSNFNITEAAINEVVEKIVEFEYVLANNYSTDAKTRWQAERSYNLINVESFNSKYPSFSIKTYLSQIAINANPKVIKLITSEKYQLQIYEPKRMAQISAAIKNNFNGQFTPDIFGNYLYYRLLNGYLDYFPESSFIKADEFLDKFKLKRKIYGRPKFEGIRMPSKKLAKSKSDENVFSTECVDETVNYFQYANARVFIDKIWPTQNDRNNIRAAVNHIADTILVGMESMIDQLSWMSKESKKGAYSKIQYLVRNIAYPDWITNNSNLTQYYSMLNKDFMSGNFPEMLEYLNAFNQRISFEQLLRKNGTDRKDFLGPPGTVNAWYQPEVGDFFCGKNEILNFIGIFEN